MPRYVIRSGCQFRRPDGSLAGAGDEIELPEDVAQCHADKLDLIPEDAVQASAPSAAEEHY